MPRYLSWLAVAVAAGFLVVASVGFAASTVMSRALPISVVTVVISPGIAYGERHHKAAATTAVLVQTRVPAGDRTGGSRMRSTTDLAHDRRDI
jgi:hypothetical protein